MNARGLALAFLPLLLLACDTEIPTGPPEVMIETPVAYNLLASPDPSPELVSTAFLGGPGDQWGYAVAVSGGAVYAAGRTGGDGLLANYSIPLAAPEWSSVWGGNTFFYGVAPIDGTIFGIGGARPPTCGASDGRGDTEHKSAWVRYSTGGAFLGCGSQNYFSYRGGEGFNGIVAVEGGVARGIYTVGGGEEMGWGGYRTTVARFDASGVLLWKRAYATDLSGNPIAGSYTRIGSNATNVAWMGGYLYIVGYDRDAQYAGGPQGRGMLLKYDAASQLPDPNPGSDGAGVLVPEWASVAGVGSWLEGVTALDGFIYAVGATWPGSDRESADFLAKKYDESGNLLWTRTWGGAGKDWFRGATTVGGRLFAVGYTGSGSAAGSDAVLVELDPVDGSVLSTTLFGGADDDSARRVATDGADLFVVGESRSFTDGGNGTGQSDLMLLHYRLEPPVIEVALDIKPGSETNPLNTGSKGRLPVAVLTTEDFEADAVDPTTVTLGDDDGDDTPVAAQKRGRLMASLEDVDGDGDLDLMLHFETQALVANGDLSSSTTQLCLNGQTFEGIGVHGCDAVRVLR